MSLLETALAMHAHGYSVVPVRPDGSKSPAVAWKAYAETAPTEHQLRSWFEGDPAATYPGLGIITGRDGIVMLEAEGRAVADKLHEQLATLLVDSGLGEVWGRLCAGWMELTPSGGLHWYARVLDEHGQPANADAIGGNRKLARRPSRESTPEQPRIDVLFETRGAGGFSVTAPSGGRSHLEGKSWLILAGGPTTPAHLSVDEYDAVLLAMSTFDQLAEAAAQASAAGASAPTAAPASRAASDVGTRPGDDYNTRLGFDGLLQLLVDHGWTRQHQVGSNVGVRRPGKDVGGISGTIMRRDDDTGGFYCWSTSTEFETERPYDALGTYAVLEHHGDISKAASALRKAGYGAPLEEPRPPQWGDDLADLIAPLPAGQEASAPAPPSGPEASSSSPGAAQTPSGGSSTASTGVPSTYTLTDDGNALRLIDANAQMIRYCPQRGSWLTWGGHKWLWDDAGLVNELARDIARALPTGDKVRDAHYTRSLSHRGVTAMVALARSDQRTVIHLDRLDSEPYQLNTPSGVVDLRTGRLLAPNAAMLHTRSTNVAPAESYRRGDAPRWERFLADTFAGDPALSVYLQRMLGQALIGTVLEQILPFAHGAGANGKTTLLGVVQRIIGIGDQGYSISAPAELLLATANPGHPTEIARLAGARLVVTSELEDGQRFAEAKVKMLTGRDTITGRFMRQDWFSFTPTHTLFLLANHQPEVRAGGEAFWRRIALLPFLHTVPKELRNPRLEDELVEHEGRQILAWLIAGAVDYLAHGITRPESVEAATSSYASSTDTVGRFVHDCCETATPGTQTYAATSAKIRAAYDSWCRSEGETPVSAKALGSTLINRFGVVSTRTRTGRLLDGIRLRPDLEDDATSSATGHGPNDGSQWWKS